jgi:hypothetical protein
MGKMIINGKQIHFMSLSDAITQLDELDEVAYIYVETGSRSPESKVVVIPIDLVEVKGMEPPRGMEYLLEVETAKDVLKAWSFMRGGKVPTLLEKVNAILYYADNDAYQPI